MKILIINQYAANLGDRAMLFFLLNELTKNGVKDITVSTHNPYYWSGFKHFEKTNIRFIPFGWSVCSKNPKPEGIIGRILVIAKNEFYKRVCIPKVRDALLNGKSPDTVKKFTSRPYWQAVQDANLIIGMGGHRVTTLLVEDALISATYDMAVALLHKKPLVLWSQTIGPLEFKKDENRQFIKKILTDVKRIYIRDEGSEVELKNLGVPLAHVFKTRDSVFGMDDIVTDNSMPLQRGKLVGAAIYIKKRTAEQMRHYMVSWAHLVDYVTDAGYSVLFFPMGIGGMREMPCIRGIIRRCKNKDKVSILHGHPEVPEHMNKVAQCRLFVGHKTHSVIFALTAKTPLVAIAYQKKTEDFMNQFGLGEYCITDSQLSGDKLVELFVKAEKNIDEIYQKELQWMKREAPRVRNDFAKMLTDAQHGFK